MTDWTMQSTERDLSKMLGDFLARRTASAKELANRIGCDPRTAEGFRAGRYWPQAKHWLGIVAAFGEDVTEAVFHPEKATARLEREVFELERQLAEKRKAAADAARHASRMVALRDRPQDRSSEVVDRPPRP